MARQPIPAVIRELSASRAKGATLSVALKAGLILVLALAPLPLGSITWLGSSILALASASVLLFAVIVESIEKTPAAATAPLSVPLLLAAIVVVWAIVQSVPIGVGDRAFWDVTAQITADPVDPSISVDRAQSINRLLHLLSYGAIFLVAWRVARQPGGAAIVVRAVALIGVAYALYGLIIYFTGNRSILWFAKWAYKGSLTSTFVNRNSFATFAGLCLIANLGLMLQHFIRRIDARSWRTILQSSIETVVWHGGWTAICLVIIGSALLLTHSRGGAIATVLGTAAFVASAVRAPSLKGPWRASFTGLAILGVVMVAAAGGSGLLSRAQSTAIESDARYDTYAGTLAAIRDHFLLGTGLGTFRFVYPPYQPPEDPAYMDMAHDDYLENALELGVPAALAFYAIPLLLVIRCILGVLRRRRDAIYPCIAVGASVLTGFHALVDFSMQIPAVAVTYAALLGVGVSQSVGSSQSDARSPSAAPAIPLSGPQILPR